MPIFYDYIAYLANEILHKIRGEDDYTIKLHLQYLKQKVLRFISILSFKKLSYDWCMNAGYSHLQFIKTQLHHNMVYDNIVL